jgi:hypothetical protein
MYDTGLGTVCPDVGRVGSALAASAVDVWSAARLGVASASAPALGTVASIVSVSPKLAKIDARVRRFMLQSGARDLLPEERVAVCLRHLIPGVPGVDVLHSPRQKAAHYGGLMVCGSVWMCPVCSAKISEKRRVDLSQGIAAWGGQIIMATFTLQHTVSDALVPLLGALQQAMRKLRGGARWMAFKKQHGLAGSVSALENTDGEKTGFHPHQHVLFFVSGAVDVDVFTQQLRDRWLASVGKVGRYASPQWGLHVTAASADIAAYVAKWGKEPKWTAAHELAKAGSKHGRGERLSMLDLLELFVVLGDRRAGARWREYALAFKGRNQLVYSPGLRALLGLIEKEKTDEELATESVEDAVLLARLDLAAWRVVLANDARGELLNVASSGDPALVRSFLLGLGVELGGISDDSS